jgi:hypothetical protein
MEGHFCQLAAALGGDFAGLGGVQVARLKAWVREAVVF